MMMTYHCEVERANRIQKIQAEIGMGQIIKEYFVYGRWTCITDTGVTIIKSSNKAEIVTIYVTTMRELLMVYGGKKKVPAYLIKKVNYNQSKYIINGKTIWG